MSGNAQMEGLLLEIWNDYADSHLWCAVGEARYSGFERDKIYLYAERLNALGIEVDPDKKLADALDWYMENAGNKEADDGNMRT